MSSSVIIRWCGPAAILAGVLFVVNGLLTVTNPQLPFLNTMSTVAVLLMVVGLAGLHALQRGRAGLVEVVGFYAVIVGTLAQLLSLVYLGFLVMVGALVILLGLALYGIGTVRARVLPLWCGMLLIATLPMYRDTFRTLHERVVWVSVAGTRIHALVAQRRGDRVTFARELVERVAIRSFALIHRRIVDGVFSDVKSSVVLNRTFGDAGS